MNSIFHRISVRKYEDKPVEKEKIMQILKAGMQAPSACNQQPWEFYVVTDKKKIEALSKMTPYTGCAAKAPVVLVSAYRLEGLVAPALRRSICRLPRKISGWKRMRLVLAAYGSALHQMKKIWKK